MQPGGRWSPLLEWFYLRPCFWWGLSAALGAGMGILQPNSYWGWAVLTLTGVLACVLRWREAATCLLAASLLWAMAAGRLRAPVEQGRTGSAITLSGRLESGPGLGPGARWILRASQQLTSNGWVPHRGAYGVIGEVRAAAGQRVRVSGTLRRPEPAGNPGEMAPAFRWARVGVHQLIGPIPEGIQLLGSPPQEPWNLRTRRRLLDINRRTLPPLAAHVANNFLLGDDAPAPGSPQARLDARFRGSGTIHLLVVSGTQVALVLGVLVWLGWVLWDYRALFWGLAAAAVPLFHALTGGSASVTRAALMGLSLVSALALRRQADALNCLGQAALGFLLLDPLGVMDIGAQLSFAAVFGLAVLAGPLSEALGTSRTSPEDDSRKGPDSVARRVHTALAGLIGANVAAHLAVAPVLAVHFHTATWAGLIANLVMVPMAGVLVYAALAHLLLASVGVTLLAGAVTVLASGLDGWAGYFSNPPYGPSSAFPPPWMGAALLLAALALPRCCRAGRSATLVWTLAITGLQLLSDRMPAPAPSHPRIRVVDVGQGDAVLLEGVRGDRILIDTGPPPESASRGLVRALQTLRIPALDAVVISHAHLDHYGGLEALLEAFPVGRVICRRWPPLEDWAPIEEAVARRRVPLVEPRAGDLLVFGESELAILSPSEEALARSTPGRGGRDPESANVNNGSLVVRWMSGSGAALLGGDLEEQGELDLLRAQPEVRADVLKLSHHGSRGSSHPDFLHAVGAPVGLVSCGRENRFGHPHREALERAGEAGMQVFRTDRGGMLTVEFEERQLSVTTHLGSRWSIPRRELSAPNAF